MSETQINWARVIADERRQDRICDLETEIKLLRDKLAIAERQVAIVLSVTGVTCPPGITQCRRGVCGVHYTMEDCQECIAEWSREQAVKEGGKG